MGGCSSARTCVATRFLIAKLHRSPTSDLDATVWCCRGDPRYGIVDAYAQESLVSLGITDMNTPQPGCNQ